jgi:hypothetical protein
MGSGAAVLGPIWGAGGKTEIGAGHLPIAASMLKKIEFLKFNTIHRNRWAILDQYLYKFKNIN